MADRRGPDERLARELDWNLLRSFVVLAESARSPRRPSVSRSSSPPCRPRSPGSRTGSAGA